MFEFQQILEFVMHRNTEKKKSGFAARLEAMQQEQERLKEEAKKNKR